MKAVTVATTARTRPRTRGTTRGQSSRSVDTSKLGIGCRGICLGCWSGSAWVAGLDRRNGWAIATPATQGRLRCRRCPRRRSGPGRGPTGRLGRGRSCGRHRVPEGASAGVQVTRRLHHDHGRPYLMKVHQPRGLVEVRKAVLHRRCRHPVEGSGCVIGTAVWWHKARPIHPQPARRDRYRSLVAAARRGAACRTHSRGGCGKWRIEFHRKAPAPPCKQALTRSSTTT